MVNHVRTLLRNLPTATDYSIPLAEYSPPTRPVRLPPNLLAIWKTLFGTAPDAYGLEYRLRQYMELVHASSLADYVTTFDTRLTYLPFSGTFDDEPFRPRVTPLGHSHTLFVGGAPPVEQGGALRYAWTVRLLTVHPST